MEQEGPRCWLPVYIVNNFSTALQLNRNSNKLFLIAEQLNILFLWRQDELRHDIKERFLIHYTNKVKYKFKKKKAFRFEAEWTLCGFWGIGERAYVSPPYNLLPVLFLKFISSLSWSRDRF